MREALICVKCATVLDKCFALRDRIQDADRQHFNPKRLPQVETSEKAKHGSKTSHKSDENSGENSGANRISSKKKNVKCNICEKFFTDNGKLRLHIITVHEKIKRFSCDICGHLSSHKNKLNRHISAVHAKVKRFSCDFCRKMCYRKEDVINHITNKHVKPMMGLKVYDLSRPFKCVHRKCKKFFKTKMDLKTHQRSHSGL